MRSPSLIALLLSAAVLTYSGTLGPSSSLAALPCPDGFRRGKTPVSLVVGAKTGCYNIKRAAAGRRLLTTDNTRPCAACHNSVGIAPVSQMHSNIRALELTLRPADIEAAFAANIGEMAGATITSKDAKAISAYLQSIREAS